MIKVAVALTAICLALVAAMAPAAAQIGLPMPTPGLGTQAAPVMSYVWYEPQRAEVESGRGIEVAALFSLAGPIKGRLQYVWPQSGDYSNLGLAAVLNWGGRFYLGAGYERTSGHETSPVSRGIDENQPYAFVGMTSKGPLYSLILEAERGFGSELQGTTYKAGISMAW
jgi:hypothetical protein